MAILFRKSYPSPFDCFLVETEVEKNLRDDADEEEKE